MSVTEQDKDGASVVSALPPVLSPRPNIVFTDVDDTLTHDGLLPAATFNALYRLQQAGIEVVPVTGASAGWCDCLIKTWPIHHIIGENGAFTMGKDKHGIVSTLFVKSEQDIKRDLAKLMEIGKSLSQQYKEIKFTQDQIFRLTDIAFDIGQTVTVEQSIAEDATRWLLTQGVQAKRSSIHINAWIGEHSKATGAMNWLKQHNLYEKDCLFIGDSPNDESMFNQFRLSIGVANIKRFLPNMGSLPNYITENSGGYGFVDMANVLLNTQRDTQS